MAHGQKSSGAGPSSAQRKESAAAGAVEFAVGTKTQCTAAFDGALHPAEVLEIRTDAAGKKQFYVHFMDCDKRLDEWVYADKLLPPHSNISRLESVPSLALGCSGELQADGQKITRRLKRRLEDSHHVPGHLDDSKHDAGPEKEHAERTKVKNVQVRLGTVWCVLQLVEHPLHSGSTAGLAGCSGWSSSMRKPVTSTAKQLCTAAVASLQLVFHLSAVAATAVCLHLQAAMPQHSITRMPCSIQHTSLTCVPVVSSSSSSCKLHQRF
jgi:hypothetical protein